MNTFLRTPISYETNYYVKDVIHQLFLQLIDFVESTSELDWTYDIPTIQSKFNKYIYDIHCENYPSFDDDNDEELYEYFSLKFSEDLVDLFIKYKELTRSHNLRLFHNKKDTSLLLEDFIYGHVSVSDPYVDDISEGDKYISNNIDELY